MTMSQAETEGFGADVRQLFVKERAALKKGHVDVDGALEMMERLEKDAVAANAEQEAAKRAQIASTERSVATKHRYYVAVSGYLDMAIAAVEKDSDAAANFRRLRSDVSRGPRTPVVETPQPLPVPKPVD